MRSSRLWLRLVVPAGLVLLVVSLAALQYRWLGQVSEAERDRRKTWLRQRAEEMSEDFDRELLRTYTGLKSTSEPLVRDDVAAFAAQYRTWRETATDPDIVKAMYLVKAEGKNAGISRFDAERGTFESVSWPASLTAVKARFTETTAVPAAPVRAVSPTAAPAVAEGRPFFTSIEPLVPSVPAILIGLPVLQTTTTADGFNVFTAPLTPPTTLVVELDRDVIRRTILPALVSRYFPARDADEYRFALIDPSNPATPIFARGVADGATLNPANADATVQMFTLRLELGTLLRSTTTAGAARGGTDKSAPDAAHSKSVFTFGTMVPAPVIPNQGTAPRTGGAGGRGAGGRAGVTASTTTNMSIVVQQRGGDFLRIAHATDAPWQLVLQHTAGSLDAAVTQVRHRNLWLSFSILAVLGAGVVLIVANAQRSQRLAAQQMDFVATVSHELRTPLAVIRSAAQNLSAGVVSEPAQARRYGDLIETEGRRLTDMVEQVLEYAGLSGNRRLPMARPVDPATLIDEVVSSNAALFDAERVEPEITIEPGLPVILGDEGALRRAINNLIANAVKHGAEGRWIGISARRAVSLSGAPEVQIAVSDRGWGIDPDDLAHIFEPFYRGRRALERQIQGNGLGLSLVRRIAEAHEGRVSVRSAPGEGATFTLHVPAATSQTATQPLSEAASPSGTAG